MFFFCVRREIDVQVGRHCKNRFFSILLILDKIMTFEKG
jgi:hypothetical protein